ncbi:Scr1 family TA system antitoxin-like transcriptional regulator [Sphaerisporangium perillae]|uniref:Scr1 family TA system antitoxin-like transcriptional regulator n=1 Tax=Sphaerisporangium perillae TaxID=2935860 RepID=UPI003558ED05
MGSPLCPRPPANRVLRTAYLQPGAPDVELADRPTISIQIVDPECLPGLLGAFMIAKLPNAEPDTVHVDSSAEGQITSEPGLVTSIRNRYEAIRLWAYPEHVSLKMIEEVKREWI